MMSFEQFNQHFRHRIEQKLPSYLPDEHLEPIRLHQAMRYSVLNPGKRLRPLLVYATGHIFEAELSDLDFPAMALELIHCYSLIHDDLPCMDDDDLRRGRPTCHIEFDEATATLAGDALQTLAFQVLIDATFSPKAEQQKQPILSNLAFASGSLGMGGGQAIDLAATGKTLNLEQLENMHKMKTGALISSAVTFGYLCSGSNDPDIRQLLDNYSHSIGLAFQIKDDILDVEGDTQTLGKPKGSDSYAQKATYPALLGLSGAKEHAYHHAQLALRTLDDLPYNTELLASFSQHIIERDK